MRATWKGEVIAESGDTLVVEGNHYFPADSLRGEFFKPSDEKTICQRAESGLRPDQARSRIVASEITQRCEDIPSDRTQVKRTVSLTIRSALRSGR